MLNAASGNPRVSVPGRALVSDRNFQSVVLAIAREGLRIARAQARQLARTPDARPWDTFVQQRASGLPPMVAYGLRLPTRRRPVPESEQLAAPASLYTLDRWTWAPKTTATARRSAYARPTPR